MSECQQHGLADRCVGCDFLPWSKYCSYCREGRPNRCDQMFLIRCYKADEGWMKELAEEKAEEAAAAPSGRRARRSCRGSADAAIKEQTVDDAHPAGFHESAHDKASERQPTTDQARMRCSSDSWPRVRRLAAQRAMGGRG